MLTNKAKGENRTASFSQNGLCGFEAGDANLRRFVGNDPTDATDPSGLIQILASGPPSGDPVALANNLSGKLNPAYPTIDFGSGSADIQVTTQDYNQGGNRRKYIKIMVKAQNQKEKDIADMRDAHWFQTISATAANPAGKPVVVPYTTDFLEPNEALTALSGYLPVATPGPVGVGLGCLAAATAYYGVGDSETTLFHQADGAREADIAALTALFYDEGGTHERDATSLAIYDAPKASVNAAVPEFVMKATDSLVLRGKVIYEVTWTQTTKFQGPGKPPIVFYDIVSSGVPVAVAPPEPSSLPAGYWDPAFKDPVNVPNPLHK